MDKDYLANYGVRERSLTGTNIAYLSLHLLILKLFSVLGIAHNVPQDLIVRPRVGFLDFNSVLGAHHRVVAYAVTILDAPYDERIAFLAGSADGMTCWLNNRVLIADPIGTQRVLHPYSNVVSASLMKGKNTFLCKVHELYDGTAAVWGLHVAISSLESARRVVQRVPYPFVNAYMFSRGSRIVPEVDLYSDPTLATFRLCSVHTGLCIKKPFFTNTGWAYLVPSSETGVYNCSVSTDDMTFSARIYLGDPVSIPSQYGDQVVRIGRTTDAVQIALQGWMHRIAHLYKAEHYDPGDTNWQRKVIYAVGEIERAAIRLHRRGRVTSFFVHPGYQIRGYRSVIDGAPQYYGLHVPSQYHDGEPLPIALLLMPALETNRPFLEGKGVSDADRLEMLDKIADMYKLIIAEPQGRGNASGWPIQEKDFEEVLFDITRHYAVNKSQIYLIGDCEAGREAILLAEHFPSRFAALAVYGPTDLPKGMTAQASEVWQTDHDIIALLGNLRNTPTLVLHGSEDTHTPLSSSRHLVDRCNALGGSCTLNIISRMTHETSAIEDLGDAIVPYLLKRRLSTCPRRVVLETGEVKFGQAFWVQIARIRSPENVATVDAQISLDGKTISVHTQNVEMYRLNMRMIQDDVAGEVSVNTDGDVIRHLRTSEREWITFEPRRLLRCASRDSRSYRALANVFDDRVVLVSSSGASRRVLNERTVTNAIALAWQEDFFVPVPQMSDVAPDWSKLRSSSIVLVGSAETNRIWQQIAPEILSFQTDGITYNKKRILGGKVIVVTVERNPLNSRYNMVLIGTNSPDAWHLSENHLWSLAGFTDFIAYRDSTPAVLIRKPDQVAPCTSDDR